MYTPSLADILVYVGNGIRMMREREAVYKAQHIIFVGWNQAENNFKAACIKSSALTPHKISLMLSNCVSEWMIHCSCKGGANGRCKHSVAALLYIYQ